MANLRPRELVVAAAFCGLAVLGGVAPGLFLDRTAAAVEVWVARLGR
jgi:hypothetical protein